MFSGSTSSCERTGGFCKLKIVVFVVIELCPYRSVVKIARSWGVISWTSVKIQGGSLRGLRIDIVLRTDRRILQVEDRSLRVLQHISRERTKVLSGLVFLILLSEVSFILRRRFFPSYYYPAFCCFLNKILCISYCFLSVLCASTVNCFSSFGCGYAAPGFFVVFVVIELCQYHSVVPNTLKLTTLVPARVSPNRPGLRTSFLNDSPGFQFFQGFGSIAKVFKVNISVIVSHRATDPFCPRRCFGGLPL